MRSWLFGCMLCFVGVVPTHAADLFIEGAVGYSMFQRTTPDGTWWQAAFPHEFDLADVGYKGGVGVRLGEHWSVTASYVRLGAVSASTEAVGDDQYDAQAHHCLGGCATTTTLVATDTLQGPELTAAYRWTPWVVQPYLKGGAALMGHVVRAQNLDVPAINLTFKGDLFMLVGGGGLCYGWVCVETTYYHAVAQGGFPVSNKVLASWLVLQVPIGGER